MDAGLIIARSNRRRRRIAAANEEESSTRERRTQQNLILLNGQVPGGKLDESSIERILSKIPVRDFFRFLSVCKGWHSFLIRSPSFLALCSKAPRKPWFYMLNFRSPAGVVYDTEDEMWRHIKLLAPPQIRSSPSAFSVTWRHQIPMAASGGLVCFRSSPSTTNLTVCNLLTGSARRLPELNPDITVIAVSMRVVAGRSSYEIVVAYGREPPFGLKVFSLLENNWKDVLITEAYDFGYRAAPHDNIRGGRRRYIYKREVPKGDEFLRGPGIIHRNPAKELSGVMTSRANGTEIIYFLNRDGGLVAFDIRQGTMYLFPQILPPELEYSVDLVECGGQALLVVLVEMMESTSLRVWRFDWRQGEWKQLMAMPPAMSQAYHGKNADINCVGCGDLIMVCVSSTSNGFHQVVMCNISEGTWVELPKCFKPGTETAKRFVSAYCFEPRIEACV